ncbi:MAG: hypothetical protein AAB682_01145 [Patescibacteria group bacterium]
MLTFFPALLNFRILAPLILRVGLVIYFVSICARDIARGNKGIAGGEILTALLLGAGYLTQPAAILGIAMIGSHYTGKPGSPNLLADILAIMILLSLLVTGPGFLSIDLPL